MPKNGKEAGSNPIETNFSIPISGIPLSLEILSIAAIAIGIMLRLLNLGSREFWYDEVLSLVISTGQKIHYQTPPSVPVALSDYTPLLSLPSETGLGDILQTVRNLLKGILSDPHPPLSYLSLHIWLRLFGNSEAAMRSVMALFSVGAIACAYGLGKTLLGHRGGLLLAALLATNPFYLSHSVNARMYAPLILWTILSAWAMLALITPNSRIDSQLSPENQPKTAKKRILWSIVLSVSVAAGMLTQYLFAFWLMTLGIFVLLFDRRQWWQHGLRLGAGVALTLPWVLWGTRQQIRNAAYVVGQVSSSTNAALKHLQDITQTLGAHLILGDWVTSLPDAIAIIAGCIAIAVLAACTISLWRHAHRELTIALALGILPLSIALTVDILTNKFTVGFGWGRAMSFILPGCLLLLALCLERKPPAVDLQTSQDRKNDWRKAAAAGLLLLYLTISIGDFSLRQRWVFHSIANVIAREATTPTLIAINSKAWGHVLRLAYYIPPSSPVMLLSENPDRLADSLEKVLTSAEASQYRRLIWLDSANPVWSRLKTEAEKIAAKQRIQQILQKQFKSIETQQLTGTMNIDGFTLNLYNRFS
ncbi:glycosyltransferase family 39 protein [Aerosakkonema funiforme]|uniref:glycosyltransferase family 39 protein n=1 Tax=Aerosakkonema funiforme TaxID=1246630 RepID=UPI0035B9BC50